MLFPFPKLTFTIEILPGVHACNVSVEPLELFPLIINEAVPALAFASNVTSPLFGTYTILFPSEYKPVPEILNVPSSKVAITSLELFLFSKEVAPFICTIP